MHAQVADRFGMEWKLFYDNKVKRVAILVSRMDHCLYDILIRHRSGWSTANLPLACLQCRCAPCRVSFSILSHCRKDVLVLCAQLETSYVAPMQSDAACQRSFAAGCVMVVVQGS